MNIFYYGGFIKISIFEEIAYDGGKSCVCTKFIFITGLHNKPLGCGASVASAAGPFTTKKITFSMEFTLKNFVWKLQGA
jgi:hypothetical protein